MRKAKERNEGPDNKQFSEKNTGSLSKEAGSEDSCRCKEVAAKKPSELLKLMISDLAFWKKKKPLA